MVVDVGELLVSTIIRVGLLAHVELALAINCASTMVHHHAHQCEGAGPKECFSRGRNTPQQIL
jgi:hypothetical protein